jgi:hypothetical protein
MEDFLIQNGAVLVYGLIIENNLPSVKLVESLGFRLHRTLVMPGLFIRKEVAIRSGEKIRFAKPEDLTNVANLLNETWRNHELYEPTSADILSQFINRTPKFSIENLLLLENKGEILACLGFWDWSQVMKLTVKSLNTKMKIIGRMLSLTRVIPKALKPGDELNQIMLTIVGFKEPSHLAVLVRQINNVAFQKNIKQIFCISEQNHPMLNSLKGFFRISTSMSLYIKALKDNLKLHEAPDYINGND